MSQNKSLFFFSVKAEPQIVDLGEHSVKVYHSKYNSAQIILNIFKIQVLLISIKYIF